MIISTEIILYVADQERSKEFYSYLFNIEPVLHVPGMTEFQLGLNLKLGLMPENGIAKIIGNVMPHPSLGNGLPRCELYLKLNDLEFYIEKAKALGAICVDELMDRDWGDKVIYFSDPDGHIIALAETIIR
jgi:predicted enzyme related to lactoylglutathione lyase